MSLVRDKILLEKAKAIRNSVEEGCPEWHAADAKVKIFAARVAETEAELAKFEAWLAIAAQHQLDTRLVSRAEIDALAQRAVLPAL